MKKIIAHDPVDILSRKTEIIAKLQKGAASWRYINAERHLAQEALILIKSPKLDGKTRIRISELLEPFGVFIHGNLQPFKKPFKPEKILPFDFHHSAPQLRKALIKSLEKAQKYTKQFPDLNKRGAMVAQLKINVTLIVNQQKIRKIYVIPIQGRTIMSIDSGTAKALGKNGHAETAFWHHIASDRIILHTLKELKDTVSKQFSPMAKVYKINTVLAQLSGSYEMCDSCHESSQKEIRTEFKDALEKGAHRMDIRTPTHSDGIAMGVQYTYVFSPLDSLSANSYSMPAVFTEQRAARRNFNSNQVLVQRRMGNFNTVSADTERDYTLFVSNGPDHDELRQWFSTGNVNDLLERTGGCTRCATKIRYEHEIEHYISGKTRVIGSECITKHPREFDVLDSLDEVEEDLAERKKIITGHQKNLKESTFIKSLLVEGTAISGDIKIALDSYCINGFFSPKEAVVIILAMKAEAKLSKKKIKIVEVKGEDEALDSCTPEQLKVLNDYCALGNRALKKLAKHIQIAQASIEEKIKHNQEAACLDFLKRMSQSITNRYPSITCHLDLFYKQGRGLAFGHLRLFILEVKTEADCKILSKLTIKAPNHIQLKKVTCSQVKKTKELLPTYYDNHLRHRYPHLNGDAAKRQGTPPKTPSPHKKAKKQSPSPAIPTPKKRVAELRSALCKLKVNTVVEQTVLDRLQDIAHVIYPEALDPSLAATILRTFEQFKAEHPFKFQATKAMMTTLSLRIKN